MNPLRVLVCLGMLPPLQLATSSAAGGVTKPFHAMNQQEASHC